MKILALSDIHNDWNLFNPLFFPSADIAVVAGDLTEHGIDEGFDGLNKAGEWLRQMGKRFPMCVWIPGNHDVGINSKTFNVLPNVICGLDRTVSLFVENEGKYTKFSIHGVSMCTAYGRPDLLNEFDYMTDDPAVENAAYDFDYVDLVLSHSPPLCTLDIWDSDKEKKREHIGSRALARYIRENSPQVVVCGHVHGAKGTATIGKTQVHNVARDWSLIEIGPKQERDQPICKAERTQTPGRLLRA